LIQVCVVVTVTLTILYQLGVIMITANTALEQLIPVYPIVVDLVLLLVSVHQIVLLVIITNVVKVVVLLVLVIQTVWQIQMDVLSVLPRNVLNLQVDVDIFVM